MGGVYGSPEKENDFRQRIIDEWSNHLEILEQVSQATKAAVTVQHRQIKQLQEQKQRRKQGDYTNEDGDEEPESGATSVTVSPASEYEISSPGQYLEEAISSNEECISKQADSMVSAVRQIKQRFEHYTKEKPSQSVTNYKKHSWTEKEKELEEKCKQINSKYEFVQAELNLKNNNLKIAEKHANLLRKDIDKEKMKNKKHLETIQLQKEEQAKKDKQAEDIAEEYKDLKIAESSLREEMSNMEEINNKQKKEIQKKMENCIIEYERQIKRLEIEGEDWRMQNSNLSEQHRHEIKQKDENNETIVQQYLSDIKYNRQTIREMGNEIMELNAKLVSEKKHGEENTKTLKEEMKYMCATHTNELREAQEANSALQYKISILDGERNIEVEKKRQEIKELQDNQYHLNEKHYTEISTIQEANTHLRKEIIRIGQENREMISNKQEIIKTLKNENIVLITDRNNKIKSLNEALEEMKSQKQKQEDKIKTMQEYQTRLEDEHDKHIKHKDRMIENMQTEISRLLENQKHEQTLKQELERKYIEERAKHQDKANDLEGIKESHKHKIEELHTLITSQQSEIDRLKKEISSLQDRYQIERKCFHESIDEEKRKNASLIKAHEKELSNIQENNSKEKMQQKKYNELFRKQFEETASKEKQQHSITVKQANDKIEALKRELVENKQRTIDLEHRLEEREKQLHIPVQIYYTQSNDLASSAFTEIKVKITERFASLGIGVSVRECTEPKEVSKYKPCIVFCVSSSRLRTDVSFATKGLTLSPMKAIVILHHKDEHALPVQGNSERVLTSSEFKEIGQIIDMAFISGKGVYACEMNTEAVNSIVRFLRKVHDEYLSQ